MARRTNALALAIGGRLTATREARGLSMQELAELALVDRNTVYRLSHGRILNPGIGTIADLARALEVDPSWLGFGVGRGPQI